jgi:hypothetical protein
MYHNTQNFITIVAEIWSLPSTSLWFWKLFIAYFLAKISRIFVIYYIFWYFSKCTYLWYITYKNAVGVSNC